MQGRNYRHSAGMPYTRREYIGGNPQSKIAKFSTGQASGNYDVELQLVSTAKIQVRSNALEAARVAANKNLQEIGETNYHLLLKPYPHIVTKENRMIATAGADRLSMGMRLSFGKPTGRAARVNVNDVIMLIRLSRVNIEKAREALKTASSKLPMDTRINEVVLQKQDSE